MKMKFLKKFRESKNRIYSIFKHKYLVPLIFAGLTLTLGIIGFLKNGDPIPVSILNSLKLFGLDFPSELEKLNWYIYFAVFFAIITITFTITLIFIKDGLEKFQRFITFRNDHIAVFGLGEASIAFLSSYSKGNRKERIVIIESDPNNKKLEEYRDMGFGVLVGDSLSESTLQRLNFKRMKYAIIAMGSDGINIELAKRIIKKYKEDQIKTEIKLIIHILNRDLDTLFVQNLELKDLKKDNDKKKEKVNDSRGWPIDNLRNVLCPKKIVKKKGDNEQDKNEQSDEAPRFKIDIKTFSFFNEAAEGLFEEHSIDGKNSKYIKNDETFKTILIGNGELLKSVIYQMALISHLPNQNEHIVTIVEKDANSLLEKIKKHLHYKSNGAGNDIDKFPKFKIRAEEMDRNTLEYFSKSIWTDSNLINVIIAYDTEAENLDLAIELFNRTYMSKAMDETDKENIPKIIFAVYEQLLLSEIIDSNKEAFKHFYTFGNSEKVLSYTSLIEEEKDLIARLIHSGYEGKYNPTILKNSNKHDICFWQKIIRFLICKTTEIEDPIKIKWYDSVEYGDKLSNIAQAKHIDMILKVMGFERRYVFEDTKKSYPISFKNEPKLNDSSSTDSIKNGEHVLSTLHDLFKMGFEKENGSEDTKKSDSILFKKKRKFIDIRWNCKKLQEKNKELIVIKEILLRINRDRLREKFDEERESLGIEEKELISYTEDKVKDVEVVYFPAAFDTLFEKMIRMEHNRWMAYHYLNGWEYKDIKRKDKKEHNCLIPLKDFKNNKMKKTVIYDMYSFLYLPNYLAEAGYEIVPIKDDANQVMPKEI